MKVGVIAADELRDRQKFISKPLLAAGHDVRVIKTRPFISFSCSLASFLLKNRPDIIIFMGAGPKELLALGFIRLAGVPFAVRLGGDRLRDIESVAVSFWNDRRYLAWVKYKLQKYAVWLFLKETSAGIVVNETLAKRVANQLKPTYRLFVIPQFCEGPSVVKDHGLNTPVKLITVANFRYSEKAEVVIWLIDKVNHFVLNSGFSITLQIAGAGLHLESVKAFLDSHEIADRLTVELLGFVTDLDSYYRNADVFLYRSFHDATPNVILESKRYGLPLLANDCEEFRTLVQHCFSGIFYRDADEFIMFLKQILSQQELREKIGRGAISEHEVKFSVQAAQVKLESAFMEIIGVAGR